jgi:hypothetical protein
MNVDIVINATSVSAPDESPEMADLVAAMDIKGCELVVDLNYNRRRISGRTWPGKQKIQVYGRAAAAGLSGPPNLCALDGAAVAAGSFH